MSRNLALNLYLFLKKIMINNMQSPDELSPEIDSKKDKAEMEPESFSINIPDVNEIPGQENITPLPLGEMAGTTISSADEEGEAVFEDEGNDVAKIDKEIMESEESNVSREEKKDLFIAANDMPGDDQNLRKAALDETDNDGAPLNEAGFNKNISPDDLDIPGAELDDANEAIGEEDEENNDYSLNADNGNIPEDQF